MPRFPGVNHLRAVRALERAGFRVIRQGKHIAVSDGVRFLTIPRANPINAYTMGGIIRDAGLTNEEFRELLYSELPWGAARMAAAGIPMKRSNYRVLRTDEDLG